MNTRPTFVPRVVLGLALLVTLGLVGCSGRPADPFALNTLHRSTFSRVKDSADETAMLFADRTHALVADDIWSNKRLYLVDLAAAKRTELKLPATTSLNLNQFVYGDDAVYALYAGQDGDVAAVYRVTQDGAIAELTFLKHTTTMIGREPPRSALLQEALASGALDQLRAMEKQLCAWDATKKTYAGRGTRLVRYFANQRYLVESNVEPTIATLQHRSSHSVVDSCDLRATPRNQRYSLELTRTSIEGGGLDSALDARMTEARLYRDGQLLHTYTFAQPHEFYYWATWVGNRLYFVGTSVSYIDLGEITG